MLKKDVFPLIQPAFDSKIEQKWQRLYKEGLRFMIEQVLPEPFWEAPAEEEALKELCEHYRSELPFMNAYPCPAICDTVPCDLSFYILADHRPNSFKFFFEMISRWLVPGKRLEIVMIHATDFRMPQLTDLIQTICEVVVHVESLEDLEEIQRNLPLIETEIRLGMHSSYYARRIMEIKGQTMDEKTALIHDEIAHVMQRWPALFEHDLVSELQHVLVFCPDEFKGERSCRHMSRIISYTYLFRRMLKGAVRESAEKRHLFLKLFRSKLHLVEGKREVLSLVVGVNFIRDKEFFDQRHLLMAIQHYLPNAEAVEGSYFFNRRGSESFATLYVEIEKKDGKLFSAEEIRILRTVLPEDLKGRIEQLMHPVFMPCNEEEVMRNILSLSNQIKFLRDVPQVIISFDEQTEKDLFFSIILVRVMKPGTMSIEEMFRMTPTLVTYLHDRCKMLGYMRKKNTKEATVFRLQLPKNQFLRKDHSIDLYKARQVVVNEMTNVIGEFRDYNGGMISKQNELLSAIRALLSGSIRYDDLLLENFFFSLTPVIMRTVVNPEALRTLFGMLLESIERASSRADRYALAIRAEPNYVFMILTAEDEEIREGIQGALSKFFLYSTELAQSAVTVSDVHYFGYLYKSDDPLKQREFCQTIQQTINTWNHELIPQFA